MRVSETITADCQSYLIQAFSEIYVVGREMGGDPQVPGELIGLLYGITAASTFAFYIEFLSVVIINVFLAI